MKGSDLMNEQRCILSDLYASRIASLHAAKLAMNDRKRALGRVHDSDDWGFVVFPDFHYEPPKFREDGVLYGGLEIAGALRKWLREMPPYVHKDSALGGAWVDVIQNHLHIGLRPEDDVPEEIHACWAKYNTYPGFLGMNHCGPDMRIGLELGWGGLLAKVRYYRRFLAPADTSFYDMEEETLLGIREYVSNVADEAARMAESEEDPTAKANLLEIAGMNRYLVDNPPRTMREACQFLAHFQSADRTYYSGGALSQLDELLRPYYERDVKDGILTDEEACWYIASLFYNDTHYSQIAGLIPDGSRDMTSRLSFLILDALHYLRIPVNVALRVSDKVNPTLLRRSLAYTLEDGSGVDYSCNVGVEEGYAANGYPLHLARLRAKVGCNWVALPGIEYPLQDVTRANMAMAFQEAMKDIRAEKKYDLEYLFERTCHHIGIIVESIKVGYDKHYESVGKVHPELVLNLFMHGPIERGLNAQQGVDIVNFNIDGIALATVADSFAALETRIVNEKRMGWEEFFDILDQNYEGHEDVRLMMANIRRFGSPGSPAEKWAKRLRDFFVKACTETGTPRYNLKIIPGMFSHGDIYVHGRRLAATPNGRRAGEPISHSNEPDPGFARGVDTFSPSLKASAVAIASPGRGNSAPLHLDIDTEMLEKAGGIDALIALIHTHNHMGGTLINLNCLSRQVLLEAHADPSTHPDLVVRVTGYSAFFSSLTKEYRQQVVDRFLTKENR